MKANDKQYVLTALIMFLLARMHLPMRDDVFYFVCFLFAGYGLLGLSRGEKRNDTNS